MTITYLATCLLEKLCYKGCKYNIYRQSYYLCETLSHTLKEYWSGSTMGTLVIHFAYIA